MSKQYEQKFRNAWLKDPVLKNWLTCVESTTEKIAKCKFCGVQLASRYADLKNHGSSQKHRKNENAFLGPSRQQTLSFPTRTDISEVKRAEGKIALFISQHVSINLCDHLVDVCKSSFPKCAEKIQMHRTKCSNVIKNVLSPHFTMDLRDDVGNGKYSLLIDESTDVSVQKYLGIIIIYFSHNQNRILNSFLDLVPLVGSTAQDIVESIKETLTKCGFSLQNLVGIGTDNASVMTGINNGVHQKLKEENPNIILIRCICHSLQLAVSFAAKECLPRNLEFLIQETYNWFSKSSARQGAYNQIFKLLNENQDPLKIVQACGTRWLSIEPAVSRIQDQWLELKTHFSIAKGNEKCYKADLLYQMYNDDINYAFICFIRPVLVDLQKVNKSFESNDADPTKLLKSLMFLLQSFVTKICVPGSLRNKNILEINVRDYIDNFCYLGYKFESKLREMKEQGFSGEKQLRERCINFILTLIDQIKIRLPDNIKVLENISMISVEETCKPIKGTIIELLEILGKNSDFIEKVQNQWQIVHLVKWKETTDTKKFWYEIYNYKNGTGENPFKELANFALELLIIPHSNAEVERLFSTMNIVKNKLRNRLQLPMLCAILSVKAGLNRYNMCCHSYEIPENIVAKIKTIETYSTNNVADEDVLNIMF